ncbi:putative xylanase/chitin deacetylase [Rubidibacter lacunae KORDI 51-2]|uniref:Putative xylanase/chitin deacetylase n=1 Tax=Rubidibacter lacunae KORDI 51-2 TaxID=582515 RepID=U5DQ96_9CHRO|nr:polysaccharide deacetylase family protein [Rubidibacter lacunae]ERN41865.1 putative xylanase/chitin deacetylase [Rubidibacter lacunae KORDI 51-2]
MQLAPLYPWLYRLLAPSFPHCLWRGPNDRPIIALTFDDGPHPIYTPQLLAVLDRYCVPASFIWLGACVRRAPHVARAVSDRGHWIGLHGDTHRAFIRLNSVQLRQSLDATRAAIVAACPQLNDNQLRDVRPPNSLFLPQTLRLLRAWHYRPVMWTVVPEDWERPGCDRVCQRVLLRACNGAIVVLHDGVCGGQDIAATVSALIPALRARGFSFTTLADF